MQTCTLKWWLSEVKVLFNLKLFEPKHNICTHNIKINYLVQSDLFVNGSKMKNCDNVRTTCANILQSNTQYYSYWLARNAHSSTRDKNILDTVNSYESTKYTSVQFYLHMLYISFISAKMLAVINVSYLIDHPIRWCVIKYYVLL